MRNQNHTRVTKPNRVRSVESENSLKKHQRQILYKSSDRKLMRRNIDDIAH